MPNIEIKARYRDHETARRVARELGATSLGRIHQIDTYFETRVGKLKLRESDVNGSELIPYIKVDQAETKRSDYARLPAQDPALVKRLLGELLGARLAVDKIREVFLVDNVRVHLDDVEGLGSFLEFEAVFDDDTPDAEERERAKLRELMSRFGVEPGDLLEGSYPDLLVKQDPAAHFKRIYENHAEEYDRLVAHEDHEGNILRALRQICALRGLEGAQVVEIGAGTGRLTTLLAPNVRGIVAFDASKSMLEVAERNLRASAPRDNWRLGVADNRALPIPDASADLVLAGWTLGHLTEFHSQAWVEELDRAMRELKRVTRPGGSVVVIETLGTCVEQPRPPTAALADYYSLLENRHDFNRQVVRTDYRFGSVDDAERSMRFFFGPELADRVRAGGSPIVPEYTGVWHLSI